MKNHKKLSKRNSIFILILIPSLIILTILSLALVKSIIKTTAINFSTKDININEVPYLPII